MTITPRTVKGHYSGNIAIVYPNDQGNISRTQWTLAVRGCGEPYSGKLHIADGGKPIRVVDARLNINEVIT